MSPSPSFLRSQNEKRTICGPSALASSLALCLAHSYPSSYGIISHTRDQKDAATLSFSPISTFFLYCTILFIAYSPPNFLVSRTKNSIRVASAVSLNKRVGRGDGFSCFTEVFLLTSCLVRSPSHSLSVSLSHDL